MTSIDMTLEVPPWDGDVAKARRLQTELAAQVRLQDDYPPLRRVAGVDVGFEDGGAVTRAAAVLLDAQTREPVAEVVARQPTRMPYIPGLLSFRELPAVLQDDCRQRGEHLADRADVETRVRPGFQAAGNGPAEGFAPDGLAVLEQGHGHRGRRTRPCHGLAYCLAAPLHGRIHAVAARGPTRAGQGQSQSRQPCLVQYPAAGNAGQSREVKQRGSGFRHEFSWDESVCSACAASGTMARNSDALG